MQDPNLMLEDYLKRIFNMLDSHENTLKTEMKMLEDHDREDADLSKALDLEIERKGDAEDLHLRQQLEWLNRHSEVRKRSRNIVQRGLDEIQNIRSALEQFEFHERITVAEIRTETLRQRRDRITVEMIPDLERRMQQYQDECKEINSQLLTLNEEISLLRRRSSDVPKPNQ